MLLSDAKDVRVGTVQAKAVYAGDKKIWPSVPAFSPPDLTGLAIWFDASQLPGAAGSTVDPWPNLAAGGVPGTMVTDGSLPMPKISTAQKNGLKLVRFTVSEGRLRMNGTGVDDDFTLVYVARMLSNSCRIVNGIYAPNNILFGFWNGYEDVFYDNGFSTPDTKVPWTSNWKLYSALGQPGQDDLYANGVLLAYIMTAQGFGGTFAISGYDPTSSAETCDCEVAEVVLYNRKLVDADRQTVEAYLRGKWGL
jgi:hypothetical protein